MANMPEPLSRVLVVNTEQPRDRVRSRWFVNGQLAGELLLSVGEAQIIYASLLLGADQTRGGLQFMTRGYLSSNPTLPEPGELGSE